MARNGYSAIWRSIAFGWVFAGSSGSGKSSAYAVNRRGDSRLPLTQRTDCQLRITCWASSSKVSQPNAVWVSDITYIRLKGWLYLAGHKDLFTGELVGYAMGERMTRNLVSQSLFRALRAKRPARGLMHSDRGSQYCSQEFLWSALA